MGLSCVPLLAILLILTGCAEASAPERAEDARISRKIVAAAAERKEDAAAADRLSIKSDQESRARAERSRDKALSAGITPVDR